MKKLYGVAMLTVALIATTLLLGKSHKVAAAQSAQPAGIKNVVMVHGAFEDGSGWEVVAKILEKDGYTVTVPTGASEGTHNASVGALHKNSTWPSQNAST
jgi:ABC-type proline/glycine betaine transport system substrate-binding protein